MMGRTMAGKLCTPTTWHARATWDEKKLKLCRAHMWHMVMPPTKVFKAWLLLQPPTSHGERVIQVPHQAISARGQGMSAF